MASLDGVFLGRALTLQAAHCSEAVRKVFAWSARNKLVEDDVTTIPEVVKTLFAT